MIDIQALSKRFGKQVVLDGVDLRIDAGQSIVIIGQSGSGKSVLLKHLIRFMEPDSGRVLFNDQDLSLLNEKELGEIRRRFGMLFQSAALFDSMTVAENVGLGLSEARLIRQKR